MGSKSYSSSTTSYIIIRDNLCCWVRIWEFHVWNGTMIFSAILMMNKYAFLSNCVFCCLFYWYTQVSKVYLYCWLKSRVWFASFSSYGMLVWHMLGVLLRFIFPYTQFSTCTLYSQHIETCLMLKQCLCMIECSIWSESQKICYQGVFMCFCILFFKVMMLKQCLQFDGMVYLTKITKNVCHQGFLGVSALFILSLCMYCLWSS